MKKILALLATLAVAFSLTIPTFAKETGKKSQGHRPHTLHASKKSKGKGNREGQKHSNRGQKEGSEK